MELEISILNRINYVLPPFFKIINKIISLSCNIKCKDRDKLPFEPAETLETQ